MQSELEHLDIVDLLSERHLLLRRIFEKSWNSTSEIYISNSEWYIMARLYKQQPTISHIAKYVDISRQATHKCLKSLEAKGLVEIRNVENNRKDKCLKLTVLGEECYEKNENLKQSLEKKIASNLGEEQLILLKGLLKVDWGLNTNE